MTLRTEPHRFVSRGGGTVEAERGALAVPASSSVSIDIAFVRFPSTTKTPAAPLIFLAGGPGESAIAAAGGRLFPAFMACRGAGDVIALDIRGAGESRPSLAFPEGRLPIAPDTFQSRDAMLRQLTGECRTARTHLDRIGLSPEPFTTPEIVRDIDRLRAALGVERVNLWGYSFGSHVAMAALRLIPNAIDRVVLCGLEGPDHTYKLPSVITAAVKTLGAIAKRQPAWAGFDLLSAMREVLDRLDHAPVALELDGGMFEVGGFAARYMITRSLTDRRAFGWLPSIVHNARKGNFKRLADWLDVQWRRRPRNAVYYICDAASGASDGRMQQIRTETSGALLADAANFPFPDINEVWQAPDLGDDFRAPLTTEHPILCISGTLDSNTPVQQAEEIRAGFSASLHVIVEHAAHNELASTNGEWEIIRDFLKGRIPERRRIEMPEPLFFSRGGDGP